MRPLRARESHWKVNITTPPSAWMFTFYPLHFALSKATNISSSSPSSSRISLALSSPPLEHVDIHMWKSGKHLLPWHLHAIFLSCARGVCSCSLMLSSLSLFFVPFFRCPSVSLWKARSQSKLLHYHTGSSCKCKSHTVRLHRVFMSSCITLRLFLSSPAWTAFSVRWRTSGP